MTPPGPSPIQLPIRAATIIRRAEIKNRKAVSDAVWKLANASPTAAHWSRAAYDPYVAIEASAGDLHAKVLFLACVDKAAPEISPIPHENLDAAAEQIVGFATLSAIMSIGAGECILENMAVAGPWQNQGIGRRLLSAGMLWCRAHAARSASLEVRESNQAAIALYEQAEFIVVGRRPQYYRDPVEAALQMRKILVSAASAG